jgi:hypothetical protein
VPRRSHILQRLLAFAAHCRHETSFAFSISHHIRDELSSEDKRQINERQIDDAQQKGMAMMKKLMLALILGLIISGPATPIFKGLVGIGPSHAYAANDDSQGDDDDQGEDGDGQ